MRRILTLAAALSLGAAVVPGPAGASTAPDSRATVTLQVDDATLARYAAATWQSFVKLVEPRTGFPADNIGGNLHPGSRSAFTSPTNIGMYLWATLAARDLGLISGQEATERIAKTLGSVEALERHEPSGQFYNWYDPRTLEKLTIWPENGDRVFPFLSSVDNGWLASALLMVANAVPELHDQAWALATSMNFGCYYDPNAKGPDQPGLIRGGFWLEGDAPDGTWPKGDLCGMGEDVLYTGHHYGAFNTEPRIASYIGIALGQIPPEHYFGPWRTFPDTCDWAWQEQKPVGVWRNYLGVDVFEGAYLYDHPLQDDQLVVPTWGGSMFEALMVPLVVPEADWGPQSWAVTHPLYVESQIEYGLDEAEYGYWGFSPASNPAGGYREYGVDAIGMEPNGYTSDTTTNDPNTPNVDERLTLVDYGRFDACPRLPDPIEDYGEGVVTPHAAFLALEFAPEETMANLAALEADFPGLYGRGGFKDSVNVATGQIADRYLALDQGMVIAAAANELLDGQLRDYLAVTLEDALAELMAMEQFGAGRIGG